MQVLATMASISEGLIFASAKARSAACAASSGALWMNRACKASGVMSKASFKIVERKMAGGDAVVAGEDFFQNGAGTRRQFLEARGVLECVPALRLSVALLRRGGSKSGDKHGRW